MFCNPPPINFAVYGDLLFSIWISRCSNTICWKEFPSVFGIILASLLKINGPNECGCICGVCFVLCVQYLSGQHRTVCISVELQCAPSLVFFFQDLVFYPGLFFFFCCFIKMIEISVSIKKKSRNLAEIFVWIVLASLYRFGQNHNFLEKNGKGIHSYFI